MTERDAVLEALLGEIVTAAIRWKHDDIRGTDFLEVVENCLTKFKDEKFAEYFRLMDS